MVERSEELKINSKCVRVLQGDLTEMDTDAVVNAANNRLWMGGGVAGALKRKGGKIIEEEAVRKRPIPIGEAAITTGGELKAKYVIHAAGMGTDLKTDANKIRNATHNALRRAHESALRSIAFPSIGTGVGGFPITDAAKVMLETVVDFLRTENNTAIENVIFALYDTNAYNAFAEELKLIRDSKIT